MRLINPIILTVFLSTLLQSAPINSSRIDNLNVSTEETIWFEETPCMFEVPQGVTDGTDIQCGYLHVPEEYENLKGPFIRLAVAIIKSHDPNPQDDPLVMAQGGPGGSTIHTYITQLFTSNFDFVKNRDIILLEQRGTLYSEPALTCPEILEETIRTLDEDLTLDENLKLYEDATAKCHDRLVSSGINLSAYDSIENAFDFESLRTALGIEKYNLYGVSYGTLLALHVIKNEPGGLRSVILDAVVPPQINFVLDSPQSQARAFNQLFSACYNNQDCNLHYPELERVFGDTTTRLSDTPADITITDFDSGEEYPSKLNGDAFRSAIFQMLYSTEIIPLLPKVIYDASIGDFEFLQRILSLLTIDRTMSYGMYYSVLCAEDADFTDKDINLNGIQPEIAQYEKENILSFLRTCEQWKVKRLDSSVDQPVKSDIPTLVLNGDFDPITPPSFGEEAVKNLKNSYSVTFPSGGHGSAMSGKCQNQIIQSFLDNPDQKPDTACIDENPSPKFMTKTNTIFLPVLGKLMNLQGNLVGLYGVLTLGTFIMLGAPIIWFIIWFFRKVTKKAISPGSKFAVFLHWLASLNSVVFVLFLGFLTFISLRLALQNNILILYGLPSTTRILFLLPIAATILTLVMAVGSIIAWVQHYWSFINRVYYSLLTLTGCMCILILASWRMIFAFFQ